MSFDLFYMSSHFGSEPVEQKNVWTGEVQKFRPSLPLTPDELSAVQNLLRESAPTGPGDEGCYVVTLPNGGVAEVFGDDLSRGFMVAVRGEFSPAFLELLYRLLKDGNLLLRPAMEDAVTIGANESSFDEIPDDMPQKVVCNSGKELGVLLSNGLDSPRTCQRR